MKQRAAEPGSALTEQIIGLAIKVHRKVGPGLYEAVYKQCLCRELNNAGLSFETEVPLPLTYEDMRLDKGYRAEVVVARTVLLELKSVDRLAQIHTTQTLTYLRLSGCRLALLTNFNAPLLKDGLHRFIA